MKTNYKNYNKIAFFLCFLISFNLSAQWVAQISNITANLGSIFFTDLNTGYAVGDNGAYVKTTDGGTTWTKKDISISGSTYTSKLTKVYFPDADNGFILAGSAILRTEDAGESWSKIFDLNGIGGFYSMHFINSSTGCMGASSVGSWVYTTTNGGATIGDWTSPTSVGTGSYTSVFMVDANTIYGVNSTEDLSMTTDGTNTWNVQTFAGFALKQVVFPSGSTGYVFGSKSSGGYAILKTTNASATWDTLAMPSGKVFKTISFVSTTTGYAFGSGGIVYKTTDGANTWQQETSPVTSLLSSTSFPTSLIGYAAGNGGTIIKLQGPAGISTLKEAINIDKIDIYPNPASTSISLGIHSDKTEVAKIILTDLLGKKLFYIETANLVSGNYNKTVDVSDLDSGTYLIEVKTNNGTVGKKLIVCK